MGNRNTACVGTTATDTSEEAMQIMALSVEEKIQKAVQEAKQELQEAMEQRLGAVVERLEQRLAAVEARQTSSHETRRNQNTEASDSGGLEERLKRLEVFVSKMIEVEAPKVEALLQQLNSGRLPEPVAAESNSPTTHSPAINTSSPSTIPAPPAATQHRLSLGDELLIAAKEKTAQDIQRLLEQGADVNFRNNLGQTALYAAAYNGHSGITSTLIRAGATVNIRDEEGQTALHDAAFNGNMAAIRALVDSGASINSAGEAGRTPLHLAALFGKRDVLQLLIDYGADVNAGNEVGRTPLHRAAFNGNEEAVRVLIAAGASKSVKDKYFKIPYDYATNDTIRRILCVNRLETSRLCFRYITE